MLSATPSGRHLADLLYHRPHPHTAVSRGIVPRTRSPTTLESRSAHGAAARAEEVVADGMWLVELPPLQDRQDQALLAHARAETLRRAHETSRTRPEVRGPGRPAAQRLPLKPARTGLRTRPAGVRRPAARPATAARPRQSSTAVASTSTSRSGSPRAATPSRVIGLTGSTPSFAAARFTPSPSSGIFSGLQSTT